MYLGKTNQIHSYFVGQRNLESGAFTHDLYQLDPVSFNPAFTHSLSFLCVVHWLNFFQDWT